MFLARITKFQNMEMRDQIECGSAMIPYSCLQKDSIRKILIIYSVR